MYHDVGHLTINTKSLANIAEIDNIEILKSAILYVNDSTISRTACEAIILEESYRTAIIRPAMAVIRLVQQ